MAHLNRGTLVCHRASLISRGLGNLCRRTIERAGPTSNPHFYCSSEGNAGLAAASAARILGKRATICVTNNTPQRILDRLKTEGAEVRQAGHYWSDADDLCRELVSTDPEGVSSQLGIRGLMSYIVRLLIMRM